MDNIAKRALKLAVICLLLSFFIALFTLYVLLNQIDATAGMSQRLDRIEAKLKDK
ncbi:DUF5408 family protein [Helicobacter cholecystus]|uniref:DUF5408 family protein n=1 Tax=Helicobacter cholecystus TaxID=45498 RepID=UPI000F6D66A2|nr:DUF5408 family protein [Helicobacter cholecystus]VEJ24107.1 Uncharacterised protein [Helicobacter cholecystus]